MRKRLRLVDRLLVVAVSRLDVGAVQRILVEFYGQRLATARKLAEHAIARHLAKQYPDHLTLSDRSY